MIVIPPYQTAVSLFHKDGSVQVYASLAHAKKELGIRWISNNVGKHFREYDHSPYYASAQTAGNGYAGAPVYRERSYVMRNDFGEALTAGDFQTKTFSRPYFPRCYWRHPYWNGEGPVPGTRKWRGGGHYYRRLRTIRSHRQAFAFIEEGEVAPRGRQGKGALPDAWDDYLVSAREDRSWKRHRKTQYKVKKDET